MRRSFLAWRWAFKLSALVAFFPSSCLRRCHSRCCFVRLRVLRSCVGPAPATRRHSATLSNPARHRCDVIYCSTACLSADRARRDCDETLHPHAFWCARAWFMMCCAWCSRAWGWAQLRASSAASQKNKRGCPSAAKRRRRRRRKSRIGSMAAAAPRRRKWAARCGLAIGPLSLRSRRNARVFCAADPKLGQEA